MFEVKFYRISNYIKIKQSWEGTKLKNEGKGSNVLSTSHVEGIAIKIVVRQSY